MQKKHVVETIKKELEISEKEYKEALEIMLEKISAALIKGEKVTLRNFGTFSVKIHKPRHGINPKTLEALDIPQKRVVKFNSCKELKKRVNIGK